MSSPQNDRIDELITRHLTGEATTGETRTLFSWIDERPENKRHFDEIAKSFELTEKHFGLAAEVPGVDLDAEWDRFTENVGISQPSRKIASSGWWLRIAAAILFLIAASALLYFYARQDVTHYQTADNKQSITLPDGSEISLNRNTQLSYESDFGNKTRTVTLEGEAFFNVKENAARPFIILTEKATIRVIGTSFNVKAYDSESDVRVVVTSGVVSVSSIETNEKVELKAGQKGVLSKATDQLVATTNDDVNFQSWNTLHLEFHDRDLLHVLETLENIYNIEFTVRTEISPACVVTVTFDQQSLESVMRVLERTLNLKYTISGNKITITEAGC